MIRKNIIALLILFSFFLTDIGLPEEVNNFSIESNIAEYKKLYKKLNI